MLPLSTGRAGCITIETDLFSPSQLPKSGESLRNGWYCKQKLTTPFNRLFPLSVRSLGSATATATNWGSNFLIGLTFLPMMETLAPVGTFALYTLVCAACWWTVYRIYPETAGLGLEDVGGLLRNGWGVDESLRRWAERKRGMRSTLA